MREKEKPQKINGIGDVVRAIVEKIDRQARPTREGIEDVWREAVKEEAARHSRPVSLRKNTLVIQVDDSSWLYQLTLEKEAILKTLRERLGEEGVRDIHLRIGDV